VARPENKKDTGEKETARPGPGDVAVGFWVMLAVAYTAALLTLDFMAAFERGVSPAFYGIAAQVLPVFLIALAIEHRAFQVRRWPYRNLRIAVLLMLAYALAGEATALYAVAFAESSPYLFGQTAGSLVLSAIGFALLVTGE